MIRYADTHIVYHFLSQNILSAKWIEIDEHCWYNPKRLLNCTNPRQLFRERKKKVLRLQRTNMTGEEKKKNTSFCTDRKP